MLSAVLRVAPALALTSMMFGCPAPEDDPPPDLSGGFAYGNVITLVGANPIAGVEICMHETDTCTESMDDGSFELEGLPEDEDVILALDHIDYFIALGMWNTSRKDDQWNYTLPTEEEIGLQVGITGGEVERGKGQVFFAARTEKGQEKPGVPGLTLSGDAALGDAVYANDVGLPDTNVTETTSAGNAIFVNVEPGVYEFTIDGVDGCEPYFSMNASGEDTFPIHVFSNALSAATIVCEN